MLRYLLASFLLMGMTTATATELTIERIFAAPDLQGPAPRALRFAPDGHYVTWLQGADDDKDRLDLWGYDLRTGQRRRLVDARRLAP